MKKYINFFKKIPAISWICYLIGISKGILEYFQIYDSTTLFNKYSRAINLSYGEYYGNDKFDVTITDIFICFETILIWIVLGYIITMLNDIRLIKNKIQK